MAPSRIGCFNSQLFTLTGLKQLPAHLEQRYGTDVTGVDWTNGGRGPRVWSLAVQDAQAVALQAREIAPRARRVLTSD